MKWKETENLVKMRAPWMNFFLHALDFWCHVWGVTSVLMNTANFDKELTIYILFVFFFVLQELTLADRFMVGVYSFIFASFIVTIVMLRLQRENYYYFADIFYSYTEWLVRIILTRANSYLVLLAISSARNGETGGRGKNGTEGVSLLPILPEPLPRLFWVAWTAYDKQ